jgi:proton translocating ATP synthase F1 alpha subunit
MATVKKRKKGLLKRVFVKWSLKTTNKLKNLKTKKIKKKPKPLSKSKSKNKNKLQIKKKKRIKFKSFKLSGAVVSIKDGVAKVLGLKKVKSGEMVCIGALSLRKKKPNGMVLSLNKGFLSIAFFDGGITNIKCGDRVFRAFRLTSIPISLSLFGRTFDSLASPLDGKQEIKSKLFLKVDTKAIGIIPRESVKEPMQTGVIAVDALTPIGCGQRELIIGDRQTGKTSLALDSIISQLFYNSGYCIYVGVGQKKASVAKIHNFFFGQNLYKKQALKRLVIISSSSSDSAVLQFLAPYTGCTIGE